MGGYGSGRQGWRLVVEDGFKLNIYFLQREGLLNSRAGTLWWRDTATKERVASVSYSSDLRGLAFTLTYSTTVDGCNHHVRETISLVTTGTNFGGIRYWWLCPGCFTRCGMLYLPYGRMYFRCRRCYNLTYQSSNESRKFDGLFRSIAEELKMPFDAVKGAIKEWK